MRVIQCCTMIGWAYLCIVILRSFCSRPKMVSDKNTRRNILTIIALCSLHRGIIEKDKLLCYFPQSACFRTKSSSLGNLRNVIQDGEVVSLTLPTSRFKPTSTTTLSKSLGTRSMRGLEISYVARDGN